MLLKLILRPSESRMCIPCNYSYYFSSNIYNWIKKSSPTYSKFLHEHGFSVEGTNRKLKHFCFSNLVIPQRDIQNSQLKSLSPEVYWYIDIPVDNTHQHLNIGIFENQKFHIGDQMNLFVIKQVEAIPEPKWSQTMKFRMLSPLINTVVEKRNGKFGPHYLKPTDPRLNDALHQNLLNKYLSLYDRQPENRRIKFIN